jgi:1-acyl-sn-glycerol-3-phosphate acyltransferase
MVSSQLSSAFDDLEYRSLCWGNTMHLFNASSLFNENAEQEILSIVNNPEELKSRIIDVKNMLLKTYKFKAYKTPDDFTTTSYIIATNHLTDSDAPLIMSFYYELMRQVMDTYPVLFVFAKENCFNGVSIPIELMPILELEKVIAVDRNSFGGSKAAMKAAVKWFAEGIKPKHYLIFSQGTIYDINKERADDIEPGAFWLARLLDIPVLPAFIEQAVEGAENRLVFGKPMFIPKDVRSFDSYKQLWLERVIEAQNELETLTGIPAREAVLDDEHQMRKRVKPTI